MTFQRLLDQFILQTTPIHMTLMMIVHGFWKLIPITELNLLSLTLTLNPIPIVVTITLLFMTDLRNKIRWFCYIADKMFRRQTLCTRRVIRCTWGWRPMDQLPPKDFWPILRELVELPFQRLETVNWQVRIILIHGKVVESVLGPLLEIHWVSFIGTYLVIFCSFS